MARKQISTKVLPDLIDALDRLARRTRVARAKYIEEGIALVVKKYARKRKGTTEKEEA